MRHQKMGRTLGRKPNHRLALRRNMAVALFTHGQITTTIPKAKALRPFVEKLISMAKKGDLHNRRMVISRLGGDKPMIQSEDAEGVVRNRYGEMTKAPKIVKHLFEEIAPRYTSRDGGYTRIIKLSRRRLGDATQLCVLQLVGDEEGPQVSGNFSRRREKANRRMEFASSRRGGAAEAGGGAGVAEAPAEDAPADAAESVASPEAEAPVVPDEQPAEEAPEVAEQAEEGGDSKPA